MSDGSVACERVGFFKDCPILPPTAIFHLSAMFRDDKDARKLNLGVGAYRDESLKPYVFSVVRKAEATILAAAYDKEYLPVAGLPAFTAAAGELLLGSDSRPKREGRLTTFQTLSGTGGLTLAAHFLRRLMPGRRIFCSEPTWENHAKVINDSGLGKLESYRYYDAATRGLDFEGMCADLRAVPEGSIILLHACAHNPTGVDPTPEQWVVLRSILKERKALPWFDTAYQGFASGSPDTDAATIRMFAEEGDEFIVCQSFAKNFGLYAERIGALHVVAGDRTSARAAGTLLESIVRPMYSNPPVHGARIVATVLGDADLAKEWRAELATAMARVKRMRALLRAALEERKTPGDWSHITSQIGMFSYTGLTAPQCARLIREFHVYLMDSGRINVAGMNEASIPYLADAIHTVVTTA